MTSPSAVNPCSPLAAAEAGSGLTVAAARSEADKAIERLRRVIPAGCWSQAALMRIDTDLDPIRSRPDFQLLIIDLVSPIDPFAPGH